MERESSSSSGACSFAIAYTSDLTNNKNVSALAWNHKNSDLLAVGYGPFEYNDNREGLVCCWCLKNQDVCFALIPVDTIRRYLHLVS